MLLAAAVAFSVALPTASLWAEGGQAPRTKDKKGGAPVPLVWPLPPEAPRVRYLTTYHGSTDFNTKKPGRWKTALLGNSVDLTPADTFVKPYAVAVSPAGRIYVSDTAARRVFALDPDKRTVTILGEGGSAAFSKPVGVAVDAAGDVFVSDATFKRVLRFAPDGTASSCIPPWMVPTRGPSAAVGETTASSTSRPMSVWTARARCTSRTR